MSLEILLLVLMSYPLLSNFGKLDECALPNPQHLLNIVHLMYQPEQRYDDITDGGNLE